MSCFCEAIVIVTGVLTYVFVRPVLSLVVFYKSPKMFYMIPLVTSKYTSPNYNVD